MLECPLDVIGKQSFLELCGPRNMDGRAGWMLATFFRRYLFRVLACWQFDVAHISGFFFFIDFHQPQDMDGKDKLTECNDVVVFKGSSHTRGDRCRVVQRAIRAAEINQVQMVGRRTQQRMLPRNTQVIGIEGAQIDICTAAATQRCVAYNIQPDSRFGHQLTSTQLYAPPPLPRELFSLNQRRRYGTIRAVKLTYSLARHPGLNRNIAESAIFKPHSRAALVSIQCGFPCGSLVQPVLLSIDSRLLLWHITFSWIYCKHCPLCPNSSPTLTRSQCQAVIIGIHGISA